VKFIVLAVTEGRYSLCDATLIDKDMYIEEHRE